MRILEFLEFSFDTATPDVSMLTEIEALTPVLPATSVYVLESAIAV